MGHTRSMSPTLLQGIMKPDREKQPCRGKQKTEQKASDIASQREMPKAHGRGVTHPDRRALAPASCALDGFHLELNSVLSEEANAVPGPCLEVIS